MIEPFFFGPNKAFAIYHPPANVSSTKLVIICPPLFDEYQRSYRALANLASALASTPQGTHVVRIDYSGTGEALGHLKDATLDGWMTDIYSAIEEGIDLTGADKVILIGVRFGATLASQCRHKSILKYLFWDPIESGEEFLENLSLVDNLVKSRHASFARDFNLKIENIPYTCFDLSNKLKEEINCISTAKLYSEDPEKVFITTTSTVTPTNNDQPERVFSGYKYDWPSFHQGNLIPKQVLERLSEKVLER
jgi:hypothetical protein